MIVVKPLSEKYNTIHLLKWLFFIGLLISFPLALPEFLAIDWQQIPLPIWWRIGFVVLGTTFMNYLLMTYAISICGPPPYPYLPTFSQLWGFYLPLLWVLII